MFVYEVFPAYIFPLLNGFSIVCLATQHASPNTQDIVTNIFGGAWANEGLGLLNFSFDWQYIGSYYVSVPLIQQGMYCQCACLHSLCNLLTSHVTQRTLG
jgi:hypothetical protein